MAVERYDIFQLDKGQPIWLESVATIDGLRSRLAALQTKYFDLMVYDTKTDSKIKPQEVLSHASGFARTLDE